MKFAKELDDDLVPEWRSKYLNYKEGKKKIKAVKRALREASRTPNSQPKGTSSSPLRSPNALPFTHYDFNARRTDGTSSPPTAQNGDSVGPRSAMQRHQSMTMITKSPPINIPEREGHGPSSSPERTPLQTSQRRQYGSFVGTPPDDEPLHRFELPDPAMDPTKSKASQRRGEDGNLPALPKPSVAAHTLQNLDGGPATTNEQPRRDSFAQRLFTRRNKDGSQRVRFNSLPASRLRKMFQAAQSPHVDSVQLEAYEKVDARQDEFFTFLDTELKEVEDFYKSKEEEASDRLSSLRKQLHELRDRRMKEIQKAKTDQDISSGHGILRGDMDHAHAKINEVTGGRTSLNPLKPLENMMSGQPKVGRVSKSLQKYASPPGPEGSDPNDRGDYVRRSRDEAPTYRVAKRRLKLALQEFYRGLELLKSYTLLNRTAFRKINKKYDKAINARPVMEYYSQNVEGAYFVKSNAIHDLIVAVEDLYARYFEKGNHKVAIGKLRSKLKNADQSPVSFRNGLYVAAGSCFAIAGLIPGLDRLFSSEGTDFVQTSYLLQLYGGYFLAVLLFLFFVLNCRMWTKNRINYAFVFEYDPQHTLDWRELAELPCFFLFLNGVFLYVNFKQHPHNSFYLYWPLVLIVVTLLILAVPARIFYFDARRWWGYSNFRLIFAGFYPVEFRDFYLGDMYTSSTYAMSQIEVFFCLYVNGWKNPPQCSSRHSRVLGFLTALPGIWRAAQCIRRFSDSRKSFPHLANGAKYCCNILYYTTLSIYRIDQNPRTRFTFMFFAAINSVYCTIWDIFMDWSLGDYWSTNIGLRKRLAFKHKRIYYAAICADVILRQQWILYALFTEDIQHSSAVSFFVGLAEVSRRGMWSLFRVENEHCNNVESHRASRDIPLPYNIEEAGSPKAATHPTSTGTATGADLEQQRTDETGSTVRHRAQTPTVRALQRVGSAIASAHTQDFEKKRKPLLPQEGEGGLAGNDSSDEDDEDDDDMQDEGIHDEEDIENMREAEDLVSRASRVV